ncbi:unnamed protein product [Staurois parvus]|uniref:Uncharacterized protein n=1 Tax=Staurois parvus TaxID=386267 RepID=A0ABN9HPH8_9NEOB|nr:unnamed protein product [Staurois parvus]
MTPPWCPQIMVQISLCSLRSSDSSIPPSSSSSSFISSLTSYFRISQVFHTDSQNPPHLSGQVCVLLIEMRVMSCDLPESSSPLRSAGR